MNFREPKSRYLSPAEAKRFYDRLGSAQDWQRFYENPAISQLIAHAGFDSAHSVFEFGCGTGAFAAGLLQHRLPADARYVGLDISGKMVSLALERLKPWSDRARVYQSDGSPRIPEPDSTFDHFVSTYVLDLLAPDFIDQLLSEAHRRARARRQAVSGKHDLRCVPLLPCSLLGLATLVAAQSGHRGRLPSYRTLRTISRPGRGNLTTRPR